MKNLCVLVSLLAFLASKGQSPVETLEIWEGSPVYSGKIPYSHWEDNTRKILQDSIDGYYLVFLPPVYKTMRKKLIIPIKPFYEKWQSGDEHIYINQVYTYISGYNKPVLLEKYIWERCLETSIDSSVILYLEEVAPHLKTFYKNISINDYEKGLASDTIKVSYDYHYVSEAAKVIKTASFDAKNYPNMPQLKVVYLKGFNWTAFKQINCPACRSASQIVPLQLALRDRGYQLPVTGILDERTKEVLIEFQKENNLEIGRLDIDTFEKLGLWSRLTQKETDCYQYPNSPRLHK